MIRQVLLRWIPLAGLATALSLMVYVAVQQTNRQLANDPQIQIARDARNALAAGQPMWVAVPSTRIDIAKSLSPFVTIVGDGGKILASSGTLHGDLRTVPNGVLENVRGGGEARVTWQPEPGVRIATVVMRNAGPLGGFIVAGRSLEESERRTLQMGTLIVIAWIGTLVGLFILVALSESLMPRAPHEESSRSAYAAA